jgi:ABC-type transport system involved in multi-copper enzyme maturation permease subunit
VIVLSSTIEGAQQFKSGIFSFSPVASPMGGIDLSALPYILSETLSNISLVGGLLAIIVSFDMVNKEVPQGSLKVMMSYPIFRDQILIGKYLGGFTTVVLAAVSSLAVGLGAMIGLTGMPLSTDIISRLLLFTLMSVVYMAVFFGIGMLTSIRIKNSANSLLASVTIWIVSLFLISSMGNLAATLDGTPEYDFINYNSTQDLGISGNGTGTFISIVSTDNYEMGPGDKLREILNFVSPSTCYEIIVREILETTSYDFSEGMTVVVTNTVSESLTRVLPAIAVLAMLLFGTFGACYVAFNRLNIS